MRVGVRASLLSGFLALAIWSVAAGSAPASNWVQWELPGEGAKVYMQDISCPTLDLCVAVGDDGIISSSTKPTGGTSAWRVVQVPRSDDLDHRPRLRERVPFYSQIMGVSCPSPRLCVAVTFDGNIYVSTDPTGGAAAWALFDIDDYARDTHLLDVSCPSLSLCVAVSGDRYTSGKVLTSTDPTGGVSAWSIVELPDAPDLRGVSCGTPSLCVAVAKNGLIYVSTAPTAGAEAWRKVGAPGGLGNLQGVACVSTVFCVAGNAGGNLLTSTAPSGSPSAWRETNGGGSVQITGISCSSASRCVAVDNNGSVIASTDPTGDSGAWRYTNLIPYVKPGPTEVVRQSPNGLFGVSCPSPAFCAIAASGGRIITSTDPFAEPVRVVGRTAKRPRRPRTTIAHVDYAHRLTRTKWDVARFRFFANGKVRKFLCKLDGRPFRPCRSPKKYRVRLGKHAFRVRAVGLTGLKGPIATERFEIVPAPERIPAP